MPGYIGKRHIMNAVRRLKEEGLNVTSSGELVDIILLRVPFFLEPEYNFLPDNFWEPHEDRMIRKFGSLAAFERVKRSHGLVPRGAEVGLDETVGYTEDNLSARRQSATMNSHRLVQFITKKYSPAVAEALYDRLNKKHFTERGILNDTQLLVECCMEASNEMNQAGGDSNGLTIDVNEVEAYLKSDIGKKSIWDSIELLHSYGIHSIPTLLVNSGRAIVSGAANSEEVFKVLLRECKHVKTTSKPVFSIDPFV